MGLGGFFGKFGGLIKKGVGKVPSLIKKGAERAGKRVWKGVKNVGKSAWKETKGLVGDAVKTGGDVIMGKKNVADGINDMQGNLRDRVGNVGKSAIKES